LRGLGAARAFGHHRHQPARRFRHRGSHRAGSAGAALSKPGGDGFDALVAERGLDVITFRDWQKIDAAEVARARSNAPREKIIDVDGMIGIAHT
jgi:hypothetical protein